MYVLHKLYYHMSLMLLHGHSTAADLPAALPDSSPCCYPSALIPPPPQFLDPSDEMGWELTLSNVSGHFLE